MRFIVVTHDWFVDSKGFEEHEIEAKNIEEAYRTAVLITHKRNNSLNHCDFRIVAIEDHERLVRRQLTWRERLTGRLNLKKSLT